MAQFDRVTLDPAVMGGRPCIRGQRVTVGMVLGLLAAEELSGTHISPSHTACSSKLWVNAPPFAPPNGPPSASPDRRRDTGASYHPPDRPPPCWLQCLQYP